MEFAWGWERRQFKKEVVRTSDAVERPGRKKSQRISLQGHVGVTRTVWRLGLVEMGTGYRMMKKLISTLMLLFQGWTIERKTISRETEMCSFFFNLNLFLIGGWFLYNMLVSVKHQHESAIGICKSALSWVSLPPPTLSHPFGLSQSTGYEFARSI